MIDVITYSTVVILSAEDAQLTEASLPEQVHPWDMQVTENTTEIFLHTTSMLFSETKTKMQDTQRQAIKQPQSKL